VSASGDTLSAIGDSHYSVLAIRKDVRLWRYEALAENDRSDLFDAAYAYVLIGSVVRFDGTNCQDASYIIDVRMKEHPSIFRKSRPLLDCIDKEQSSRG
jgi:hypothetical protein